MWCTALKPHLEAKNIISNQLEAKNPIKSILLALKNLIKVILNFDLVTTVWYTLIFSLQYCFYEIVVMKEILHCFAIGATMGTKALGWLHWDSYIRKAALGWLNWDGSIVMTVLGWQHWLGEGMWRWQHCDGNIGQREEGNVGMTTLGHNIMMTAWGWQCCDDNVGKAAWGWQPWYDNLGMAEF